MAVRTRPAIDHWPASASDLAPDNRDDPEQVCPCTASVAVVAVASNAVATVVPDRLAWSAALLMVLLPQLRVTAGVCNTLRGNVITCRRDARGTALSTTCRTAGLRRTLTDTNPR